MMAAKALSRLETVMAAKALSRLETQGCGKLWNDFRRSLRTTWSSVWNTDVIVFMSS